LLRTGLNGSTRIQSTIRDRDDAGTTVLIADPMSAEATFADANGNGTAGLTLVRFVARNPESGQRIPVTLETREAEDIDRDGRYAVVLRIGEQEKAIEIVARIVSRRRHPRRRR
jgi:hypothetical protein